MAMRKPGLTGQIIIAMIMGIIIGSILKSTPADGWMFSNIVNGLFHVVGKVFVISLKMLVVPLVFVSLVCGTSSLGDPAKLGRVGGKTLGLYLTTTCIAISLALLFALGISPGVGIDATTATTFVAKEAPGLAEVFINIFPSNPIKAAAEGNMLQVIVFSILFGVSISLLGKKAERISVFFNDLNEIIMKMITILMKLAPYGVFCLLAKVFAEQGLEVILPLAKYFFTVVAALILHATLTYGGLLTVLGRMKPLIFYKKMRSVWLFAFSTASSNATLPITMRTVEKRLGVDRTISSFTVPLGATINMDGTAIMQGVATVFIAQAYGIELGASQFLQVIITATLASVGTAGVPGVGLITLAMVLQQVGLPVEGIGLIIGVDRLLDMMRTAVNITGDASVTCIVAKSENSLDESIYNDPEAGTLDEATA
jgi:Na+/H+-dicarboxylate symporter